MAYADFCIITQTGCPEGRCAFTAGCYLSFVFLLTAHIQPIATEYASALLTRIPLSGVYPTNLCTACEADLPG